MSRGRGQTVLMIIVRGASGGHVLFFRSMGKGLSFVGQNGNTRKGETTGIGSSEVFQPSRRETVE